MGVRAKMIGVTAVAGLVLAGAMTQPVDVWISDILGDGSDGSCELAPDERCVQFTGKWLPTKAHDSFKMNVMVNGETVGRHDQRSKKSPITRVHPVKAGSTAGMVLYAPPRDDEHPDAHYDMTCEIKNKITGALYDSRTVFVGGTVQCFGVVH